MRAPQKLYEYTLSDAARAIHDPAQLESHDGDCPVELTAFVSCYNEAEIIEETLEEVRLALREAVSSFEIIVIDDCSKDDSSERVRRYIAAHPEDRILLRRNLVNRGLSQNFIDGAFLGRGRYYKLFCGDNTEPHQSIVQICRQIGKADIIIPNYSSVVGKGGFRQGLSATYTALVNLISGNRISYYNGLHVHRRYNIMRWHPNTRGFGFQADIVCMLLDQGATYLEVSVPAIEKVASRALTWRNFLSVGHTLVDLLIRRIARVVYDR